MTSRLNSLPRRALAGGWCVSVALTWRARLLGLAGLHSLGAGTALLLPACRSVHTAWMRFALDLVWIDGAGGVVRVDRDVAPWRVRSCRAARSVLEARAGDGEALARAWATARGEHDRESDRAAGDERE